MLRVPRLTFAAFGILTASSSFDAAQADPYRWCADYTVLGGIGARNCYFITLAQCRATISGVGGMCVENPFTTELARRTCGLHDASNRERD